MISFFLRQNLLLEYEHFFPTQNHFLYHIVPLFWFRGTNFSKVCVFFPVKITFFLAPSTVPLSRFFSASIAPFYSGSIPFSPDALYEPLPITKPLLNSSHHEQLFCFIRHSSSKHLIGDVIPDIVKFYSLSYSFYKNIYAAYRISSAITATIYRLIYRC